MLSDRRRYFESEYAARQWAAFKNMDEKSIRVTQIKRFDRHGKVVDNTGLWLLEW
jgi:ribosomal protein S1